MNKRTLILKQMTSEKISDINQPMALDVINNPPLKMNTQESGLLDGLLAEQIPIVAKLLKIQPQYLQVWFEKFQNASVVSQLTLLRLVERYSLDPLLEEVDLVEYEDHSWQAVITPQGYTRLLNACPQFKGIQYTYNDPESPSISTWIECAIYRSDRDGPITVREYYAEVKRDSAIWQKMPRRMLRNRVFQQCAKMALGI